MDLLVLSLSFIFTYMISYSIVVTIHESGHLFFSIINKVEIKYFVLSTKLPIVKSLPKLFIPFKSMKIYIGLFIGGGFVEGNFRNISIPSYRALICGPIIFELFMFITLGYFYYKFDLQILIDDFKLITTFFDNYKDIKSYLGLFISSTIFFIVFTMFLDAFVNFILPVIFKLLNINIKFLDLTDGGQFYNSFKIKDTNNLYSSEQELENILKLKEQLPISEQGNFVNYINDTYRP